MSSISCCPSASNVTRYSILFSSACLRTQENPVSIAAHHHRLMRWRTIWILCEYFSFKSFSVPSIEPSSTTRISENPAWKIPSMTHSIRLDSLYARMRKRILFFCMFIMKCDFSNQSRYLLSLGFYLRKQEEREIEEKYDAKIHECICSSTYSYDTCHRVQGSWKESKYE